MMLENKKYTLSWNCSWKDANADIEKKLRDICNEMYMEHVTSSVVVVIKNCDSSSCYDTMDIHVFENFLDANTLLNNEMYTGHAVDVYQFSYRSSSARFTNVMYKCHDSNSYGRLAGIKEHDMFDDSFVFRMRTVFDMKETTVTIHKMKL